MTHPIRALIITPDTERIEIISQDLRSLQRLVGGYIEHVPITWDVSILCNEDGISLALPINHRAMDFISSKFHLSHILYGTIILIGAPRDEYFTNLPNTVNLP